MDVPRFVKWAGGKQQLLTQLKPLFPKKFKNYFEPFVGSGAVGIHILQSHKGSVFLSDSNEELITSYQMIQTNVRALIQLLQTHKQQHSNNNQQYYYRIRSERPIDPLQMAARFIYLNKTCFNGLYRVNSNGEFNVPIGSYTNPDIVQEDKLLQLNTLLQPATISLRSFESVIDMAKKSDFVYFDPPYHPVNEHSFTAYSAKNFNRDDQKKLMDVFSDLSTRGVYCMLSNSDTPFIRELYAQWNIHTVQAKRMINSDATKRGAINEVVVTNY